MKEHSLHTD